jgi:hypothetical protein
MPGHAGMGHSTPRMLRSRATRSIPRLRQAPLRRNAESSTGRHIFRDLKRRLPGRFGTFFRGRPQPGAEQGTWPAGFHQAINTRTPPRTQLRQQRERAAPGRGSTRASTAMQSTAACFSRDMSMVISSCPRQVCPGEAALRMTRILRMWFVSLRFANLPMRMGWFARRGLTVTCRSSAFRLTLGE